MPEYEYTILVDNDDYTGGIEPLVIDKTQEIFNELGKKGWLMVTTAKIDQGFFGRKHATFFIFVRKKKET